MELRSTEKGTVKVRVTKKFLLERGSTILLQTKDSFLVEDFLEGLKVEFPEYNILKFNTSSDFLESVNTSNLFSSEDRILVLLKLDAESIPEISSAISPDSGDIYVFVESSVPSRKKSYTTFKSKCNIIKIPNLNEKEAISWVSKRLSKSGLDFTYDVPEEIVRRKGVDLYSINKEIGKLAVLYEGRKMSNEDIRGIVVDSSEARYFDFSENFLHKRLEKTLLEFNKINEYSYTGLIRFLTTQINRVYKIAIFRESGKSEEEISDLTNIPKFYIKTKYFTILNKFNKIKLLKLVDLLNDLDTRMRSSTISKKLLFESYILKAFKI